MKLSPFLPLCACLTLLAACTTNDDNGDSGGDDASSDDLSVQAALDVKAYVADELDALVTAAEAIQAAAPTPDADGWNATDDAQAVEEMRTQWRAARVSYERVEGAIAVLFPELDASTDERYDGFIEVEADTNLFDGEGVTGVHAIERILWADTHPAEVEAFEMGLENYAPPAFPTNEAEAAAFSDELVEQLIIDTQRMRDEFEPLVLDPAAAYGGVVGSMAEQFEKVQLAQTGEQESRYAGHTLADMRANLEGGQMIFAAFTPWLHSIDGGHEAMTLVNAGFDRVSERYSALSGDALPPVPETWSSSEPSSEDLASPYGSLHAALSAEIDTESADSLISSMLEAADLMDIPVAP